MPKNVAVFITCLADLFRSEVVFATIKLLEEAGCQVTVPLPQTCCGQPAYNSGDRAATREIARQVITLFGKFDAVVVPSGSCAGMLSKHYPELFADEPEMLAAASKLSASTYELTQFLFDVLNVRSFERQLDKKITYHDSCSGLRELKIKHQPRHLLNGVAGVKLCEQQDAEVCCGFGGTFCVKYSEISNHMVGAKVKNIEAANADIIAAGDLGCLMNIAGKLQREKSAVRVFHIAEILAGFASKNPGIGEPSS